LERTGLLNSIYESVIYIDQGRKWLDTEGQAEEGRTSYRKGLSLALEAFQAVQIKTHEDLELTIVAEYTFIGQELQFCDPSDRKTINSLTQAIEDFDGAFLVLKIIQKPAQYKLVEQSYSHHIQDRYNKMPKDVFHVSCFGHITRINNILRSPGINRAEKTLLEQRLANIKTAQAVYHAKQKATLTAKQFGA
jgi:hypothetical protein